MTIYEKRQDVAPPTRKWTRSQMRLRIRVWFDLREAMRRRRYAQAAHLATMLRSGRLLVDKGDRA